jgi:large subunit ribosomal protein L25
MTKNNNLKTISAEKREKKVKIKDKELIPAVVYGPKKESTSLSINQKEFSELYKEVGESTLLDLDIKGEKAKTVVLVYDTQRDPLSGELIHVDFYEPNLKEKVEAEIPVNFIGEAPAVKELSGTLVKNVYSLDVKALPQDLPHGIEVNIETLKTFDDVIMVKDLKMPSDVEILQDEEMVVAMVSEPEDVEAELEKAVDEEGEAEVITEKKEEEEEEKKEEGNGKKEEK